MGGLNTDNIFYFILTNPTFKRKLDENGQKQTSLQFNLAFPS